jgi:hypothetical protein
MKIWNLRKGKNQKKGKTKMEKRPNNLGLRNVYY